MGTFSVRVFVANPDWPEKGRELELLVDTGSTASKVQRAILAELGLVPKLRSRALAADGREVVREVGVALFSLEGRTSIAPVIFGETDEIQSIGATTLEMLGLAVDPVDRRLLPKPFLSK